MPTMEQIQPYTPLIVMAVNGLIAGWLAGLLFGGGGLIRNMLVGIIGAFVGGALVRYELLQLPAGRDQRHERGALRHADPDLDHRRRHRHHHRAVPRRPVREKPSACLLSTRRPPSSASCASWPSKA